MGTYVKKGDRNILDMKLSDTQIERYKDGRIRRTTEWKNGLRIDVGMEFHKDGTLKAHTKCDDMGILISMSKFNGVGELITEIKKNDDGYEVVYPYPNGTPRITYQINKDGLRHGHYTAYDGDMTIRATYDNGIYEAFNLYEGESPVLIVRRVNKYTFEERHYKNGVITQYIKRGLTRHIYDVNKSYTEYRGQGIILHHVIYEDGIISTEEVLLESGETKHIKYENGTVKYILRSKHHIEISYEEYENGKITYERYVAGDNVHEIKHTRYGKTIAITNKVVKMFEQL